MLSPEQLDERRKGIGGSDAPIVLGLSPWGSPMDVWRSKVEGIDPPPTNAMRVGSMLEPFLRDRAADALGTAIELPETPFVRGLQRANLDGIATIDGVRHNVQIKLTRSARRFADGVPVDVQAQVQHEMYAAGLDRTIVVVGNLFVLMNDQFTPTFFRVERDELAIQEIVRRENDWWETYVVARRPPEEQP